MDRELVENRLGTSYAAARNVKLFMIGYLCTVNGTIPQKPNDVNVGCWLLAVDVDCWRCRSFLTVSWPMQQHLKCREMSLWTRCNFLQNRRRRKRVEWHHLLFTAWLRPTAQVGVRAQVAPQLNASMEQKTLGSCNLQLASCDLLVAYVSRC